MSEQEIEAYAKSLNKEVSEVQADLIKKTNGKIKIVNWFDDSGIEKMGDDLWKDIDTSLEDLGGTNGLIKNLYDAGAI